MVWWILHTNARRGTPERHYRLARFAADNAMAYLPGPYLATHLTPWASRGQMVITRVLRPRVRRQVEFANFELIYADRMGRHTQFGGYCAIRLATRLPHILLQAAGAGRRSFAAANALGDKIAQWERWRDNRPEASPPPAATGIVPADVAPAGRRLRMVAGGATWIWVGIGIAVVVGVWIANVL